MTEVLLDQVGDTFAKFQRAAPTPDTHVFIGVFRPSFESLVHEGRDVPDDDRMRYVDCKKCWSYHQVQTPEGRKALIACLNAGHFDVPIYKTHDEVLKARLP